MITLIINYCSTIPRGCLQIVEKRNANSSNPCAKIEGNKTIVCGEHRWAPKPKRGVKGEYDTERVLKTGSELAGPGLEGRILGGGEK